MKPKVGLTAVQLIRVICAVFRSITPPFYIDALAIGALKLVTGTTCCREHTESDMREWGVTFINTFSV